MVFEARCFSHAMHGEWGIHNDARLLSKVNIEVKKKLMSLTGSKKHKQHINRVKFCTECIRIVQQKYPEASIKKKERIPRKTNAGRTSQLPVLPLATRRRAETCKSCQLLKTNSEKLLKQLRSELVTVWRQLAEREAEVRLLKQKLMSSAGQEPDVSIQSLIKDPSKNPLPKPIQSSHVIRIRPITTIIPPRIDQRPTLPLKMSNPWMQLFKPEEKESTHVQPVRIVSTGLIKNEVNVDHSEHIISSETTSEDLDQSSDLRDAADLLDEPRDTDVLDILPANMSNTHGPSDVPNHQSTFTWPARKSLEKKTKQLNCMEAKNAKESPSKNFKKLSVHCKKVKSAQISDDESELEAIEELNSESESEWMQTSGRATLQETDKKKSTTLTTSEVYSSSKADIQEGKVNGSAYHCSVCNRVFEHLRAFNTHLLTHTIETAYKCAVCYEEFSTDIELNEHYQAHSANRMYTCKFCQEQHHFSWETISRLNQRSGKLPYPCPKCDQEFCNIVSLLRHKNNHKPSLQYQPCEICGKQVKKVVMARHIRSHKDERVFQCNMCGKAFTAKSYLNKHKQLHSDVKRYKCNLCDKAFHQPGRLAVHKLSHSDVRRYVCEKCATPFKHKSHMRRHQREVCGKKKFLI